MNAIWIAVAAVTAVGLLLTLVLFLLGRKRKSADN